MKTICVYLGASSGNNPAFKEAVIKLAHEIVDHGLTLVYGGSNLGMMGLLATTVKELGGKAIGVITTHLLDKEKPLDILDELHIVDSMQERKKMLQSLADAFVVMPGGLGTLEEAIETWNAIKIGEVDKKIGFLNIDYYFNKLFSFIEHCYENGFILAEQIAIPSMQVEPKKLLRDLMLPQYEEIDCVMYK
ncbi:TIGR00730 family Rossman fold protein [Legionella anisa]|uniref:Cytokinin riboside 5'-monophosphate phosphoribohydrolase n=1 Tax=Legionella anisa TaxID=28082 RepID=A0AAX0X096_9GAMM|nr:TIGR00730 family Rossman fold protein [Legionella anisa]KTC68683.1 lysine decarboxylase [Legionella anisa]PNL73900.1 TIGR00730 family Rossman fold protein [Legionella anisa]UAK81444.1 TIGR00730 family Rossman fold protein [Legionella anisa]